VHSTGRAGRKGQSRTASFSWSKLKMPVPESWIPTVAEFVRGYTAFQRHEHRDAMYKVASFLVEHFWDKPKEIADALGVLLLTWNQALYRYGLFSFHRLERCIERNKILLAHFRERDILSFQLADQKAIGKLFGEFLEALQITEGVKRGVKSPVATAKVLHLLAPHFFPLWDDKIAKGYKCNYTNDPAAKYLAFYSKTLAIARFIASQKTPLPVGKSLLKLIDEFNYSKYTKKWT